MLLFQQAKRRPAVAAERVAPIAIRRTLATIVGDYSPIRIRSETDAANGTGARTCITTQPFRADEQIFSFTGPVQRARGDWTIQVGQQLHLGAHASDEPWLYMNHSFAPSVRLEQTTDESNNEIVLTARALRDLAEGEPVTFDYSLHEWDSVKPFTCVETGRVYAGWLGLTDKEKDEALPHAMPWIRSLHLQHLFGSESRC